MKRAANWVRTESRRAYSCGIFDLDEVRFEREDGRPGRRFCVIDAPEWINVIPVTAERQVLLVRQFRFGIESQTLEIPGGMCDPQESPADAARRELLEETGHAAGELLPLGWVHPNPPIQNNRCHTFLARNVHAVQLPSPDPEESLEIVPTPLDAIPALMRERRITHALVLAAFQLFHLHEAG